MRQLNKTKFLTITSLILFAIISRLLPHPANFTPILAIALFGGVYFEDKKLAFIIPLFAMLISDLFRGFHDTMLFVYVSFAICVFLGINLSNNIKISKIFLSTISGSLIFFIITNFGSWLTDPMYKPLSITSIIQCYTLAIPFFRNSLSGDLIYSAVIFGAYNLAAKYIPALIKK